MHHPGPPRFAAVGDHVELAPRDPDPEAGYAWRLVTAPTVSTATLGDQAVEHLVPDAPGTYIAELTAPDGTHRLTVRVFPEGAGNAPHHSGGTGDEEATMTEEGADEPPPLVGNESARDLENPGDGGGTGRPRLTLSTRVERNDVVVKPNARVFPDGQGSTFETVFVLDDRDDIAESAVTRVDGTLRIPLEELDSRVRVHAVVVIDGVYSVPDAVTLMPLESADPASSDSTRPFSVERPYDPPSWAEDALIYEIYVRTFGDAGEGSQFDAIADRLDYIESLGVDVLWLTPVLQNDHAPHGYNITDFFDIAADLGTRAEYEQFVEAAHDRGLKVVFDLVCNHSARTHPFFESAVADPDSEYRDWYEWRTETEPETYFEWEHIANFDFNTLAVRRHLLDAVDEWAPLVDGFRCDMAWAVPNGFWREIHDRRKAVDSEFLLLDETIPYIPDFQAGLFDMHFDSMAYHVLRQIGKGAPADDILDAIEERKRIGFPDHASFMLYTENHDETRYITECGRSAAEAVLGALFTLPGAPLLYAGQEFGQRGRRDDLAWDHADTELQSHVRALSALRHDQPALSSAARIQRVGYEIQAGDADRVTCYGRLTDDEAVVVVLNFSDSPARVTLSVEVDTTDLVSDTDLGTDEAGTVAVDSVAAFPAAIER